jgi:hypothetical protein
MSRVLVSSGSPYEATAGVSRAVRIHHGDVYGQTKQWLVEIEADAYVI